MRGCDYAEAGMVQTLAQGIDDEKLKRFLCDEFHPHHWPTEDKKTGPPRPIATISTGCRSSGRSLSSTLMSCQSWKASATTGERTSISPAQYPGRWRPSGGALFQNTGGAHDLSRYIGHWTSFIKAKLNNRAGPILTRIKEATAYLTRTTIYGSTCPPFSTTSIRRSSSAGTQDKTNSALRSSSRIGEQFLKRRTNRSACS